MHKPNITGKYPIQDPSPTILAKKYADATTQQLYMATASDIGTAQQDSVKVRFSHYLMMDDFMGIVV